MRICYATYIDNQAVIGYPIKFLLSEIPELKIFCSDETERKELQRELGVVNITPIGVKIKAPADIATAQNKCLDMLLSNFDFVVWIQADIFLTEEAKRIIKEVCLERNLHGAFSLKTRHLRLFHVAGTTYFGVSIIGRNCEGRFVGDGSHIQGAVSLGSDDCTIDIGYLSIPQYKRHLRQHAKTWQSDNHNYEWSDELFVKDILAPHTGNGLNGLIQQGSYYWTLVEKLGMIDDYNYVKQLIGTK